MATFDKVKDRLELWAKDVRYERPERIVILIKRVIEDLAGKEYFDLPKGFQSYVDDYHKYEGALQSITNYRDHFIHPFHVFCLGFCILDAWNEEKKRNRTTRTPLKLREKNHYNLDDELKIWFIASVYHDVGYPAEKLENLVSDVFKSTADSDLQIMFDWNAVLLAGKNISHIDKLASRFEKHYRKVLECESIPEKDYYEEHSERDDCKQVANNVAETSTTGDSNPKRDHDGDSATTNDAKKENLNVNNSRDFEKWFYQQLLVNHDHGILSALKLLSQEWKDNDYKDIALEAALAIAVHNYRYDKQKKESKKTQSIELGQLSVERFPLAFFLTYCDTAQEWGRDVLLEKVGKLNSISDNKPSEAQIKTILKKPVPEIAYSYDKSRRQRIKTTVFINYKAELSTILNNNKTLEDTFHGVARKFRSTWCVRKESNINFRIQGEDEIGDVVGQIHPTSTICSDDKNSS